MLWTWLSLVTSVIVLVNAQSNSSSCNVTTQYLADPPYDNYFYSDCNVDAQVVSTNDLRLAAQLDEGLSSVKC